MRGHKSAGQQLESDYFEREVKRGKHVLIGCVFLLWIFARHTSHVTRHTSHVTRHTSHVTRHSSQELPDSDISQDDLSEGDAPDADEVRACKCAVAVAASLGC
jgi:hypothetical protein